MKQEMVAMPVYQERISPLLDVAQKFAIYEINDDEIKQKITVDINVESEPLRIEKLKELGVTVVIGGAVSGFVSSVIAEKGIHLISWINGPADEVINHYLNHTLNMCSNVLPICAFRKRYRCGRKKIKPE